ncbi:MAG: hypothetical protein F4Z08_07255 [Chloroflexi bacterium]|nr:hypothetical protein [Chloroflexota bacterium]
MPLFAVYLDDPETDEIEGKLRDLLGTSDVFRASSRFFLVSGDVLTTDIGRAIGAYPPDEEPTEAAPPPPQPRSIILKLNGAFWGYYGGGLWEWLEERV